MLGAERGNGWAGRPDARGPDHLGRDFTAALPCLGSQKTQRDLQWARERF